MKCTTLIYLGVILGLGLLCSPCLAEEEYIFFKSFEVLDSPFDRPYDVAIDSTGNVYVADTYNSRVVKFDQAGTFIREWGSFGTGELEFQYPKGIAVDRGDRVYVADTNNHRIVVYDSEGVYQRSYGSYGDGAGQLTSPTGIAVDTINWIYVADSGNNRIQKINRISGVFESFGGPGTGEGQFLNPVDVMVNESGYIYVIDDLNGRIQCFNTAGTFQRAWDTPGYGIAADDNNLVYLADPANDRIIKQTPEGETLLVFGSGGAGDAEFSSPRGVAVRRSGGLGLTPFVYVADTGNNRVSIWVPAGYPLPPVAGFTASPTHGSAPLNVWFTDESFNNPTSWRWDLGDGTVLTEQNPQYRYETPGTYTITLTVTNNEGSSTEVKTNCITVTEAPVMPYLEFRPYTLEDRYEIRLGPGQTEKFGLWLVYPAGGSGVLSGFNLTLSLTDNGVAEYIDVEFPAWAHFDHVSNLPSVVVTCTATDIRSDVVASREIHLLDLTVEGGTTRGNAMMMVGGGPRAIQDREGRTYQPNNGVIVQSKQIRISDVLPFGSFPNPTMRGKISGTYEDLDGNGFIGFNDIVIFYNYMNTIKEGEHGDIDYFDYDENGWIGFNDVITLYNALEWS
ncbi:PKD domain-containing protein [Methanocalculus chunghsingensis]|uniref:PKD domain-containing protein n=1 Tax=Methanocalculus chunghsingensis TaxID=156457 RepID=UPI001B8D002B|nr:PKD domain-containing protein [Methanocalculus chunghsingensis]